MTRSKQRKMQRAKPAPMARALLRRSPLAAAILAAIPAAFAQTPASDQGLGEVIVTATKRSESLQDVPVSITALGTEKLEQLNITSFNDYAKMLPSVSIQTYGPGQSHIFMRGVATGDYPNHTGPLPSVGTYMDEQPVTTILGAIEVRIYDIARVEALAGPQGTLYGASSEAGTIRIITNKPDPTGFKAGYDLQGSAVSHGDAGYAAEGFINQPIGERSAIRLVGWVEHEPGYIDNVHATRTYPSSPTVAEPNGITLDNAALVKKHYNDADKVGLRAALKVNLNDSWSITPSVMAQRTKANGIFGYDPKIGDLALNHFYRDYSWDNFVQAALTVEGKVSNVDVVYAGSFLKRDLFIQTDYTEYSLAYDGSNPGYTTIGVGACAATGVSGLWHTPACNVNANPSQIVTEKDGYRMESHELRFSTAKENPVRFVGGLFAARQHHNIQNRYEMDGLDPALWVTGWPNAWWLTDQVRINRDYAAFGELSFDMGRQLTGTVGLRRYKYLNTVEGFYGFGIGTNSTGYSGTGEAKCFSVARVNGGPCENLNKSTDGQGWTPKVNLTYKFDERHMVYATWAKGFRPGGINRVGSLPPYAADTLTSTELGWKTSWAGNRVRFNGAFFVEDWKAFQFAFLAPNSNSVTQVANAGDARIKGVEMSLDWQVTHGLLLSGGAAYIDAKLESNYCGSVDPNTNLPLTGNPCVQPYVNGVSGAPSTFSFIPLAKSGDTLPVTSKIKANLTARYSFGIAAGAEGHVQAALTYQTSAWPDMRTHDHSVHTDGVTGVKSANEGTGERYVLGQQPAYGLVDLSAGLDKESWSLEFYVRNALDKRAQLDHYSECTPSQCGLITTYVVPNVPRTVGLKFGQKF